MIFNQLILLSIFQLQPGANNLVLTVTPSEHAVIEKAPLVLRLRLENAGPSTHHIFFKEGRTMATTGDFKIIATGQGDARYEVSGLTLLIANIARAPGNPFGPGQSLESDVVMCLGLGGGHVLGPGKYSMRGVLNCPPEVYSNEFEVTVLAATGDDAQALAVLPTVSFYAQGVERRPNASAKRAFGGKPDEVRAALNHIEADFPDSTFAHWLKYWNCFHGLESDDPVERELALDRALIFADENPRFPLTDNLLYRTAQRLERKGDRERVVSIIERIRTQHPDTDIPRVELRNLESKVK